MIVALLQIVNAALYLYSLIIIARAFMSFMNPDPFNPIIRFIYRITEPVLAPIRRFAIVGMWDLSPVVALILLRILQAVVNRVTYLVR